MLHLHDNVLTLCADCNVLRCSEHSQPLNSLISSASYRIVRFLVSCLSLVITVFSYRAAIF